MNSLSLKFHALVLEITDRCTAKCSMCYQASGPKGSDLRGDNHLPVDLGRKAIREAVNLLLAPTRFHIAGGESFIYLSEVMELCGSAKEAGYIEISATTNCFWALTLSHSRSICRDLAAAGLTHMEISYDSWHVPFIVDAKIKNAIHAARRSNISVVIRTLTSKSQKLDDLICRIGPTNLLGVTVANCAVSRQGRASTDMDFNEIYSSGRMDEHCADVLNLTISPGGDIHPCCAGSDMTKSLSYGNISHDSISTALFRMNTDRTLLELAHGGPAALHTILWNRGFSERLNPIETYSSICDLCWNIFKDEEMADALRDYFDEIQLKSLIEKYAAVDV